MEYECDRCARAVTFYLEDGCEGPADRRGKVLSGGKAYDGFFTASGRQVLPVPFIAAGCPTCQPKPPWDMGGGVLQHVRWHQDVTLPAPVTEVPLEAGVFYYPRNPKELHACGEPYLPGDPRRLLSAL